MRHATLACRCDKSHQGQPRAQHLCRHIKSTVTPPQQLNYLCRHHFQRGTPLCLQPPGQVCLPELKAADKVVHPCLLQRQRRIQAQQLRARGGVHGGCTAPFGRHHGCGRDRWLRAQLLRSTGGVIVRPIRSAGESSVITHTCRSCESYAVCVVLARSHSLPASSMPIPQAVASLGSGQCNPCRLPPHIGPPLCPHRACTQERSAHALHRPSKGSLAASTHLRLLIQSPCCCSRVLQPGRDSKQLHCLAYLLGPDS